MSGILLTGSRVYGEPTNDSDYDIVLLVSHDQLMFLYDAAGIDPVEAMDQGEYGVTPDAGQFKFGKLNIIALTNRDEFDGWVVGTKRCCDLLVEKMNANPTAFPFGDPSLRVSRAEAKLIMTAAVDGALGAYAETIDYQI